MCIGEYWNVEKKWFFSAEKTRWAQNHFFFAPFGFFRYIPTCMCMSANNSKTTYMPIECAERHWRGKKSKFLTSSLIFFFIQVISAPLRILRFLSVNSSFFIMRVHANSLFFKFAISYKSEGRAEQRNRRRKRMSIECIGLEYCYLKELPNICIQMDVEMGNFKCGRMRCMMYVQYRTMIIIMNVFFECKIPKMYYNLCKILNVNFSKNE